MTYLNFLIIFLIIPIVGLVALAWVDRQRGTALPPYLTNWPARAALLAHIVIALLYTTPWDNYLVATRVWWYDPSLVTGIVFGWVPLEEYLFFILQPIFTGLWLFSLGRRLTPPAEPAVNRPQLRRSSTLAAALLWLLMVGILAAGWRPGTYLALELGWALPPIMLQLAFGADILWRYRRLVLLTIVPTTLYLSAADALAISAGTWTIDPAQSLGIYLGGVLPLEEFIFFALTNILLTFGIVLVLARQSQARLDNVIRQRLPWAFAAGGDRSR